jgi:hypothetical protein
MHGPAPADGSRAPPDYPHRRSPAPASPAGRQGPEERTRQELSPRPSAAHGPGGAERGSAAGKDETPRAPAGGPRRQMHRRPADGSWRAGTGDGEDVDADTDADAEVDAYLETMRKRSAAWRELSACVVRPAAVMTLLILVLHAPHGALSQWPICYDHFVPDKTGEAQRPGLRRARSRRGARAP